MTSIVCFNTLDSPPSGSDLCSVELGLEGLLQCVDVFKTEIFRIQTAAPEAAAAKNKK